MAIYYASKILTDVKMIPAHLGVPVGRHKAGLQRRVVHVAKPVRVAGLSSIVVLACISRETIFWSSLQEEEQLQVLSKGLLS